MSEASEVPDPTPTSSETSNPGVYDLHVGMGANSAREFQGSVDRRDENEEANIAGGQVDLRDAIRVGGGGEAAARVNMAGGHVDLRTAGIGSVSSSDAQALEQARSAYIADSAENHPVDAEAVKKSLGELRATTKAEIDAALQNFRFTPEIVDRMRQNLGDQGTNAVATLLDLISGERAAMIQVENELTPGPNTNSVQGEFMNSPLSGAYQVGGTGEVQPPEASNTPPSTNPTGTTK